jgi:hypothetical protein
MVENHRNLQKAMKGSQKRHLTAAAMSRVKESGSQQGQNNTKKTRSPTAPAKLYAVTFNCRRITKGGDSGTNTLNP